MARTSLGSGSTRGLAAVGLAALATLAPGCDPAAEATPDLVVNGAAVALRTSAPFTRAADFPARMATTVEAALRYWGGSWQDLAGVTITFSGEPSVACGGGRSLGCFDGAELRLTTLDPGLGTFACVEQTVLVHEVGHAVIGDPLHTDARWMELGPVAEELSGRVGYGEAGPTGCPIYPSVWRHPLGER
jgi:hypothetical protein